MNYSRLIKNLKKELIKYPINRNENTANKLWRIFYKYSDYLDITA